MKCTGKLSFYSCSFIRIHIDPGGVNHGDKCTLNTHELLLGKEHSLNNKICTMTHVQSMLFCLPDKCILIVACLQVLRMDK